MSTTLATHPLDPNTNAFPHTHTHTHAYPDAAASDQLAVAGRPGHLGARGHFCGRRPHGRVRPGQ